MADMILTPDAALSAIRGRLLPGGGVTIRERHAVGIATMLVRRDQGSHLRERIRQHFFAELPSRPAVARAGATSFVGIAPGSWLALNEKGGHVFSTTLRQITMPFASVSDQSSGYALFHASGRAIRETLAKGFAIDLDSRAFKPGDAATTFVSGIGATIWRCEDDPDGNAAFKITVYRSLAHSFWDWFSSSAAEFGYKLLQ
jgi:methylglutamate dehydrogenase subunit D